MRLSRGTAKRNRPATRNPARLLAAGATALSAGLLAGCQTVNPLDTKSFIDPSELAGRVRKDTLVVKILNQVDPAIEEPNREFVAAQPPTQDDLVVTATDYQISKTDLLSVEISDLGGPGTQTVKTTRVTESGNIALPIIGQIRAEGKTEFELQQAIEEAYRAANILQRATVSVTVGETRGRAFTISGAVQREGQYAVVDPDFRVLDALVQAGGTQTPLATDLYIIRRTDLAKPGTRPATGPAASDTGTGTGTAPAAPATSPARPGGGADDIRPQGLLPLRDARPGLAAATPAVANPTASNSAAPTAIGGAVVGGARAKAKPLAPLTPVMLSDTTAQSAAPAVQYAQAGPVGGTADENGRFIYVDGKKVYVETPAGGAPATPAAAGTTAGTTVPVDPSAAPTPPAPATFAPADGTPPPAAPPSAVAEPTTLAPAAAPAAAPAGNATPGGNFAGFRDLTAPDNVRIIRIPLDRLRNGDLQYNVVIKPKDQLIVQYLPIGEYYVGGHVGRPSAYTLSQRRITLKQAIIAAGMLDQLAIPERTDIVRRLPDNKEVFVRVNLAKIFEGEAPDIYLKPDDQIMVGTNAFAPFIAAVRGAFRFTYGFGFLYDRNFAAEENNRIENN